MPDPSDELLLEAKELITSAEQNAKAQDVEEAWKLYRRAQVSLNELTQRAPGFRQAEVMVPRLHVLKGIEELTQ